LEKIQLKFCIERIFTENIEDIYNLNSFISKGLKERLETLKNKMFIRKKYQDIIEEINFDINIGLTEIPTLKHGDDLGSKTRRLYYTKI